MKASTTRAARAAQGDRALVRSAALMFTTLLLALAGTAGAIQASTGRFSDKDAPLFSVPSDAPLVPRSAGYIEVVVEPWADVYIDGELVATTPSSERIALPPGKHYVKYKNPYFQEQATEIMVHPGATQRLSVRLTPKTPQKLEKEASKR